jgi:tetratricopeptide (TPR) repeat protein
LDQESSGRFHGKYWLIEAEVEAVFGDPIKAVKNYEKALKLAKDAGILQVEALINENFAYFWHSQGLIQSAIGFMEIAKSLYETWGARAKVHAVEAHLLEWGKAE